MKAIETAFDRARTVRVAAPPSPAGCDPDLGPVRGASLSAAGARNVVRSEIKHLLRNRIVAWSKACPETCAFDMLRTRVLRAMALRGWHTLAVTSPSRGCGKTTLAINLALSMAHHKLGEVVLFDLDLRRPRVAAYLGIEAPHDLGDFLNGTAELTQCLVDVGTVQLRVVPTLKARTNAVELLAMPQLGSVLAGFKGDTTGRIAIFDLPPLLATDDALAILPALDCVLLVAAEGTTEKGELEEAMSLIDATRTLGVVLNKTASRVAPYDAYTGA